MGATQHDWKRQQDLLIKYNNIQLKGLITMVFGEVQKRREMLLKEDSLNKLIRIRGYAERNEKMSDEKRCDVCGCLVETTKGSYDCPNCELDHI